MKTFKELFVHGLQDIYAAENQIVEHLPKAISFVTSPKLRDALTNHLKQTKNHIKRLERIFSELDLDLPPSFCDSMEGLLEELKKTIKSYKTKSFVLDAGIIMVIQKIEHYEIATYGTLRCFAKSLDLGDEIINIFTENLEEEAQADKKLSSIAEGSFFTESLNKKAANLENVHKPKSLFGSQKRVPSKSVK